MIWFSMKLYCFIDTVTVLYHMVLYDMIYCIWYNTMLFDITLYCDKITCDQCHITWYNFYHITLNKITWYNMVSYYDFHTIW